MFMAILLESIPLIAAIVAVLGVLAIPALRRRLPRATHLPRRSRPDSLARIIVGVGAAALILITMPVVIRSLYDGLGVGFFEYWWWMYSEALLLGCLTLLLVACVLGRYRRRPHEPVPPKHPRVWRSFTTASQLWLLSGSVLALFLFVAFAGSASSQDLMDGRYRVLEIETGGTGGATSMGFFGWAYGLPTAAAAALLAALTITALHLNASRPFLTPATAADEETSRSTLSALLVWFAAGAVLVTLGRAMLRASQSAGLSLISEGFSWETTLAALAPWLYWMALLVQFLAYTILGLVICATFLRSDSGASTSRPSPGGAQAVPNTARESGLHG